MLHLLPKSPYILVVEDDPDSLSQVISWLGQRPAHLLQARTGEQALRLVQKRPVDVIISDWQLPGISGIELLQALRLQGFTGPLLICTGYMLDAEHLQWALAAGANDYLRKPMNTVEFNARLDKCLQLYAQQAQLAHLSRTQGQLLRLLQDQLGLGLQRLLQQALLSPDSHLSEPMLAPLIQQFHQLMQWSHYRFNLESLTPVRFEVRPLLRSCQQRCGAQAERIRLSGGTGVFLQADIDLLQRVIGQLLDNALRYTAGEVLLKATSQDSFIRISVLDEGTDLTEGQLERLEQGQETGLGLEVCHDLLGLMGLRLYCQLRRGVNGSHFYFDLPAL